MAAVGDKAFGMIRGRLSEAVPEPLKAYKQGFTEQEWKTLDVNNKPLYFDHKYDIGKIGHITNKWVEGGWLGVDAVVYKEDPKVKPYYEDIMNGKVHSMSAGFLSDPATESQPIRFKRFIEASVTNHPLEPGARIFVRRNDNAGADGNAPSHIVTMPFTVMKDGEALPPISKQDAPPAASSEASKPLGHDQKTVPPATSEQGQKSDATSTESPKPTQQQGALAASSTTASQQSAQPTVATSTTPPSAASQLLSNTPPAHATMSAPADSSASGQPQQQQQQAPPSGQAQQPPQNSQAHQNQPKSTTTFTNNTSNQDSSKKSDDQEKATQEQMNVFKGLQKLLQEKSARAEQKAKAEAEAKAKSESEAASKPSSKASEQPKEEQKPAAAQDEKAAKKEQPPQLKKAAQAKKEQQAQADSDMADADDDEDAQEGTPDRMSRKDMEKTLRMMQKKLEAFEKKEQEAEAAKQAEIEQEYEANFSIVLAADKALKFVPDEIRDKATTQLRTIFHTPELAEAQQVLGNLIDLAAKSVPEKAATEEEQKPGKKRGRTDDKGAETKKSKAPQSKGKKDQEAEDDEDEAEDAAEVAGFKIPSGMTPDVLRGKMKTGTGKPSSVVKVHAQSFNRGAPPVLVQRNDSSRSSTSTVFSQFGDQNAARAFEFLTKATAKYDPAAHKAVNQKWEKTQKLRAEGVL